MSHALHQRLDGYDSRQILHDGCPECEERGENLMSALCHMDNSTFERAWRRAFDLKASHGGGIEATGEPSYAEGDLLDALWGIQILLERRGIELTGVPPGGETDNVIDFMRGGR